MSDPVLPAKKRRHHYVWRHYLSAWSVKDQIWCLRKGKIFRSGLMGVAQEKYFYKLQKLSPGEIDIARKLFVDQHKDHIMWEALDGWVRLFEYPFQLADKLDELTGEDNADFRETLQCNGLEDMHAHFELMGIQHLDLLRQGKIDFFKDQDEALPFLFFLCVQYFRTKGMRESFSSVAQNTPFGDLTKIGDLVAVLLSTKLAHNLFVSGDFHLQLLENQTGVHFITSDQPVLNIHCHDRNPKEPPEKLEFHYPVTPERAVLVKENPSPEGRIALSVDEVNHYNAMMVSISAEQLFATSEAQLKEVLSM